MFNAFEKIQNLFKTLMCDTKFKRKNELSEYMNKT